MASDRKEDLVNMKLLTSKETGKNYHSNKFNKTINEYEVVLQSVDDATVVKTGIMGDEPPIPEAGTVLEKLLVYEDNFKGKITTKFLQPTAQSSGGQGGGQAGGQASSGKSYGSSPEDVKLKKQEQIIKVHQINMSYAIKFIEMFPLEVGRDTVKEAADITAKLNDLTWTEVKIRLLELG